MVNNFCSVEPLSALNMSVKRCKFISMQSVDLNIQKKRRNADSIRNQSCRSALASLVGQRIQWIFWVMRLSLITWCCSIGFPSICFGFTFGSLGFFGALAGVFFFGLKFNSLIRNTSALVRDEGFMKISNLKLTVEI